MPYWIGGNPICPVESALLHASPTEPQKTQHSLPKKGNRNGSSRRTR